MTDKLSYFFQREDAFEYSISTPVSFSVMSSNGTRSFQTGISGFCMYVTEEGKESRMTTYTKEGLPVTVSVDKIISTAPSGNRPVTDQVCRALYALGEYDANGTPKIEFPVNISGKAGSTNLNLQGQTMVQIMLVRVDSILSIFIGTVQISIASPGPNFNYNRAVSAEAFKDFVKSGTGGIGMIGIIPGLGDFGDIWYLRGISFGRLLMLI